MRHSILNSLDGAFYLESKFGTGYQVPYFYTDLNCTGSENGIVSCDYSNQIEGEKCLFGRAVGVKCYSMCTYVLHVCVILPYTNTCNVYYKAIHPLKVVFSMTFLIGCLVFFILNNESQNIVIFLIKLFLSAPLRNFFKQCYVLHWLYVLLDNTGCTEGAIRLANGNQREGDVQICRNGVWGYVCGSDWSEKEAMVVCSSQGYSNQRKSIDIMANVFIIIIYPVHCANGVVV